MSRTFPPAIGGVTVVDITIGSGKAVATLADFWAWVYTNYPDLISANRIVRGRISGELQRDTASITIGGTIVGDATRYVILTADAGQSVCDGPASSTPIRYSTSHARLVGTDVYAVPCPIPDITCKVVIEALQFRFTGVGDATLINAPAGVDLHTRSNIFYDTLGVDCIKYRKSLRSFNDVFLVDASDYIYTKCYVPIEADAGDYASEIHNPTLLSGSTYVAGSLGNLGNAETASDSLACNMLHLGGGNLSLGSDWNATHGAARGSDDYTAGANAVVGVVVADTVESDTSGSLDARMKSTALSSLRTGGYNNIAANPVDFFYRARSSDTPNRGAFDPNASDDPPPSGGNALLLQLMQHGQLSGGLL